MAWMSPWTLYSTPVCVEKHQLLLVVLHPQGGEYRVRVHGFALDPIPMGPITLSLGNQTKLPFRNPFFYPAAFTFSVDHPSFVVRPTEEVIQGRQPSPIVVSYKASGGGGSGQGGAGSSLSQGFSVSERVVAERWHVSPPDHPHACWGWKS